MQEPEKLEVETSGKKKKERHPFAHRNPPDMNKVELITMVAKLQDKVEEQRTITEKMFEKWRR